MITSDGRSFIEAEMEHMHFSAAEAGERIKLDCRDHFDEDTELDLGSLDTPLSRIARWFTRILNPLQA